MTDSEMPIGMRSMKYCVEISTYLQDTPLSMVRLPEGTSRDNQAEVNHAGFGRDFLLCVSAGSAVPV